MKFRADMYVELLNSTGSDDTIVKSALVSSSKNPAEYAPAKKRGLIRRLMQDKHGSPFESGYLEFYIEAPRAVRDEHVRHRIGSYSSSSLRYRLSENPEFYIPSSTRPLKKAENFKQMSPQFVPYTASEYKEYCNWLVDGYTHTYNVYLSMVESGYDSTEAVRWISCDGLYTPYIARFNPRSLMHFLSLRTHSTFANHPSNPMWEIEDVALKIENEFAQLFPETYLSFNDFGRESP
jgi:thymidylate synthase (FAD)